MKPFMTDKEKEEEIKEYEIFQLVNLIIENSYNIEGVINPEKRLSDKIIFTNRRKAVKDVAEAIKKYANENNMSIDEVKEMLFQRIEYKKERTDEVFKKSYDTKKRVISSSIKSINKETNIEER